ncbi:ABC transporter permease [bacterium]|nr:ABC transporter permease [bacterium]
MVKIATIAHLSLKEMIRQPIFAIILLLAASFIFVSPWFSMFTLLNSEKLVRDMGFASILLAGILIAAFCASGLVFREIENKTAVTILSKPVCRFEFIIGKYFGLVAGMGIACLELSIILVLTLRLGVLETARDTVDKPVLYLLCSTAVFSFLWALLMNYFFEKPFTSTVVAAFFYMLCTGFVCACFIGGDWRIQPFGQGMELAIVPGGMLLFCALLIVCAVAVLGSIRLNMIANLVVCLAFFFLSMTSDYFFGRFSESHRICRMLYYLIPNLQFFWVSDAYMLGRPVPFEYVMVTAAYSLVTIGALLAMSGIIFNEREVA